MTTAAQRQFLVSVATVEGYFASKEGGQTASDTNEVYNGGDLDAEKIASPPTTDNITVTRPYDPDRDQQYLNKLRPLVGRWRTTVSVQPTDPDLSPVGKPDVYADALLVAVTPPDVDASTGDAAEWQLEFAVRRTA